MASLFRLYLLNSKTKCSFAAIVDFHRPTASET